MRFLFTVCSGIFNLPFSTMRFHFTMYHERFQFTVHYEEFQFTNNTLQRQCRFTIYSVDISIYLKRLHRPTVDFNLPPDHKISIYRPKSEHNVNLEHNFSLLRRLSNWSLILSHSDGKLKSRTRMVNWNLSWSTVNWNPNGILGR